MNQSQKNAVALMHETGAIKELRDQVEQTLFELFVNAPSDEMRMSVGRKVDVVDEVFQMFEEILLESK